MFRSVFDQFEGLVGKNCWELMEPGVGGCGEPSAAVEDVEGSSRNSNLMSFPCRELGGGGFWLFRADTESNSADTPRR